MSAKYVPESKRDSPYASETEISLTGIAKGFDLDNSGYAESIRYGVNTDIANWNNRRELSTNFLQEEIGLTPAEIARLGYLAFVITDESDVRPTTIFYGREIVTLAQSPVLAKIGASLESGDYGLIGLVTDVEFMGRIVSVSVLRLPRGKREDVESKLQYRPTVPKQYKRNRRSTW